MEFYLSQNVHNGSGFHSVQWMSGFFPEVKGRDCEGDNSPPSSVEVKNEWSFTSTPPPLYAFTTWTATLPLKSAITGLFDDSRILAELQTEKR
jgi:hypothetical protein